MYAPKWVIIKRTSERKPWELYRDSTEKQNIVKYDDVHPAAIAVRRMIRNGQQALAVREDRVLQYGVSLV